MKNKDKTRPKWRTHALVSKLLQHSQGKVITMIGHVRYESIYLCAVTSVSMNLNPSNLGSNFSVFLDSKPCSFISIQPVDHSYEHLEQICNCKCKIKKAKRIEGNRGGDWRKSGGRRESSGGEGNDRSSHAARNLHHPNIQSKEEEEEEEETRRRRISTTTNSKDALSVCFLLPRKKRK